MANESLTYESALRELETIVAQMQQTAVSIDELTQQSERAAYLLRFCQERLRKVETDLDRTFEIKE
ncbi:MAG: exodeoxyribonuclease VII small subunit [Bacteroidota bacterium]